MQRSDDGSWSIPGGAVNVGETWAQAAARECLEETGWTVQIIGLLGIYSEPATQMHRYPRGDIVQLFGVVFLAIPTSRVGACDGEASQVAWFELGNLPAPLFAPDVPVLEDASRQTGQPFLR